MMPMPREPISLLRDCQAVEIPYGTVRPLRAGSLVTITQSLGGTYTVITDRGHLVRIDSKDADALGLEPSTTAAGVSETGFLPPKDAAELEKLVWSQLRTVFDPEIPVNVVELGLVYLCEVTPLEEEGRYRVHVRMTLTAPGCGMGDFLRRDAESKIKALPGVAETQVDIVFEPVWHQGMMSDEARLHLGLDY